MEPILSVLQIMIWEKQISNSLQVLKSTMNFASVIVLEDREHMNSPMSFIVHVRLCRLIHYLVEFTILFANIKVTRYLPPFVTVNILNLSFPLLVG